MTSNRYTHFKPKSKEMEKTPTISPLYLEAFEIDEQKFHLGAKKRKEEAGAHHLLSTQCFDEKKRDKFNADKDANNINPPWKF